MLCTRPIYQKSKGFTLIELVLVVALSSVLIISLYSLLDFSTKCCLKGDRKDKLLLNGRYSIEFIKDEIKAADMIISSEKFKDLTLKYPTNIGFVILKIYREETPIRYNYITYHTNKDKIVRVACTRIDNKYPTYSYFSGNNALCELAYSILNTKFIPEDNMIYFDLKFRHGEDEELVLKSDIYIRCPIDY